MAKNQHVVRKGKGWAVRKAKGLITSTHRTQKTAIGKARKTAIKEKSEVVIHGMDGKIRNKDSYGNDPCPPKDKTP
jgi:hypothetical protein